MGSDRVVRKVEAGPSRELRAQGERRGGRGDWNEEERIGSENQRHTACELIALDFFGS